MCSQAAGQAGAIGKGLCSLAYLAAVVGTGNVHGYVYAVCVSLAACA